MLDQATIKKNIEKKKIYYNEGWDELWVKSRIGEGDPSFKEVKEIIEPETLEDMGLQEYEEEQETDYDLQVKYN